MFACCSRFRAAPLGAIALSLASACAANAVPRRELVTTVILVRHADRALVPAADSPLTAAGEARARDLAIVLRDAGVQAIITTQLARTRATAAPLALLLGITAEVMPDTGASHARAVAAAILERHAGQTVLVVGHGHTVPAIIGALGAPTPARICETTFDRMYVVTVRAGAPTRVVAARYGAPSPHDAGCTTDAHDGRSMRSRTESPRDERP